jgi:hypothetical protein
MGRTSVAWPIFLKELATAAVDRLLHHALVIVTEGRSDRLTEAVAGRGVAPLSVPVEAELEGRNPG